MITNDLFNEAYNNYHANRTGFARPQRNDDERHDLDRDTRTWYIRLNGKLIRDKQGNPYSYRGKDAANKAAVNMQAKLFNQGKEFVLTTNPNDPQQGMTESTENRCMQCGMKNCSCPGDSCKCKPIAGWVPGKGFKKAVDEAANAAQQAAIAIAKKKEAGVDEGSVAKKPQPYNEPGWAKNLPKEKLDAIAGPRYKKDKKDKSVTESSQRVDSLVTDALRIMKGAEVSDAVQALKTVLGDREYNSRRGYYNFYIKQILDMYSQQGVAEEQLNELDFFAPVTTFIKMTDGSYVQADWRKSQGNPGLSDSASFVNFKPVNPNVAKQLGLDSHQRNNSISNHRDGTIVPGGPIQGSGPLANRGYEVVDYNKPETMEELPPEIKSELIKWVQKQGVAEGEGNFVGNGPQPNIGGVTVKRLAVGDTVMYFGRQAKIIGMSKTGNTSRITIANDMGGITQDVLTSDLKRTGVTEKLGSKLGTGHDSGKFLHKYRKQRGLDEDSVDDFLARGGKVQHGKLHKPRKGETWQGSSHIGTVGGRGSKGTVTGKGANTSTKSNKPVVTAEGKMTCNKCGGPAFLSRFVAEENNACSARQCSKQ